MNVLYIGEMGDAVNTLLGLSKIASKVVIINTDLTRFYDEVPGMKEAIGSSCRVWNFYRSRGSLDRRIPPRARKLWRYLVCLLGVPVLRVLNRESNEVATVKKIIEEENIQIVFASWGTDVIPDIIFIRTVYPDLPIIHHLPTFPTSQISWLREKIEIFLFRKVVPLVNGFIAASNKMKEFLVNEYGLDERSVLLCPIYYTSEYYAKDRLLPLSGKDGEPHLVCTGSTNFSYPGNNVAAQIQEIVHSKINVHCIRFEYQAVMKPYLHFFENFDTPDMVNGSLATFMTQFDGCLVLYNAPAQRLRFEFSVPQRFLFCFTVGIPIFMPKGIFRSCEEIIERYQNGIVYQSIEELNTVLRDTKTMKMLKNNARISSNSFAFESQAKKLISFLSTYLVN